MPPEESGSMITLNIEKPNIPDPSEAEAKVSETVERILDTLASIAEEIAPQKTGQLAASHTYTVSGNTGELTNTMDYLRYVLYGRGWVFPVVKKALYWEELDHPVAYARPAEANDYFSVAIEATPVESIVEETFIDWLRD